MLKLLKQSAAKEIHSELIVEYADWGMVLFGGWVQCGSDH